jgi:protein-S-isoprenylcysteine O-methyltransferase Ste14
MKEDARKGRGVFLYALLAYLSFAATTAYAVAFFGNLFVSRTIDAAATVPLGQALFVNTGLLAAFALQHSGMARPPFKAWFTRRVPQVAERSTYVLVSSIALAVLMLMWQPMGGVVWLVDHGVARALIMLAYGLGWLLMIWATCLIDHLELFGLRQAWCHYRGHAPYREPAFKAPAAYRFMRHPIYAGWLIVLWASPVMTMSHLVIAAGLTLYVCAGIRFEERELEQRHPYYDQYRRKVPMLLPSWRRRLRSYDAR